MMSDHITQKSFPVQQQETRGGRMALQTNPSRAVFVRNLQSLVEIILTDHAYTKPWSAHPEASKARPMKTLFMAKTEEEEGATKERPERDIDVCDVRPSNTTNIVYDTTKARAVMSECEKHVTTVTSKRTPDTWEELICRTGWMAKQNVLFDKVIKVLSSLRLARLSYEQTSNEPVKRRIATDKATKRFRQNLCAIEWDIKLTSWLHTTLVDGLSIPLLACYLDILQTLRAKAPSLVDRIVSNHSSQRRGPAANTEALSLLLKRPWDPSHGLVTEHKTRKLPGSPLLLIVPSGPTTNTGSGTSSKRTRFWHNQLSVLGKVVPVTMHTSNGGSGVTISQCLDHIIGAVRTKVLEVALMESVCAVVCLGFPLAGIDGVRGEMRERLKTDTSLLIVGGADEQLRLLRAKKKKEGLTQSMVDRLIMDQIGEFLGNVLTSSNNSMQQRNDLSDADESEVKKKKRKRSTSRDLATDMSLPIGSVKTKGSQQSPRKSQKVTLTDTGKNVIKIPVGGGLGALSGVRNLSQPSPAKRPRTSKAKASKANAQTSAGVGRGTQGPDAASKTMVPGIPISVAASGANTASLTQQSTPGFISLAAKGGVLKASSKSTLLDNVWISIHH
ncbi:hypothetical protein QZH41_019759 [Actinostola sp. cb2023]|nr:hypothetical protein QZH41_019759 [Actinostola sp. cb2023]